MSITTIRRQVVGGGACGRAGLVGLLLWSLPPASRAGQTRWRSGSAEVLPQSGAEIAKAVSVFSNRGNQRHIVVQFAGPVGPAERATLQAGGITLLSYLGDNAAQPGCRMAGPQGIGLALRRAAKQNTSGCATCR